MTALVNLLGGGITLIGVLMVIYSFIIFKEMCDFSEWDIGDIGLALITLIQLIFGLACIVIGIGLIIC